MSLLPPTIGRMLNSLCGVLVSAEGFVATLLGLSGSVARAGDAQAAPAIRASPRTATRRSTRLNPQVRSCARRRSSDTAFRGGTSHYGHFPEEAKAQHLASRNRHRKSPISR